MATAASERPVAAILPSLAEIVTGVGCEMLVQIPIDRAGRVMDGIEFLSSDTQAKNMIPLDLLLEHPKNLGAKSVIYVMDSTGELDEPAEADIDFAVRLLTVGLACDVPVLDVYLVKDAKFVSLRETTNLWD